MNMVERPFAGWQGEVNDDDGFIFQHHVVEWLILHGHRSRGLLRREQCRKREDECRTGLDGHHFQIPPLAERTEGYRTSVLARQVGWDNKHSGSWLPVALWRCTFLLIL